MQQTLTDGLRRQLDSCKHEYTNVKDIVVHLRSENSEYGRIKRGQLTRMVCQLLGYPRPNRKRKKNSQCPNNSQNQSRIEKRPRQLDFHSDNDGKERLKMIENGTDDSIPDKENGDGYGDGEEGTISTSEDTAFDITKSELRERYRKANSAKGNIEWEKTRPKRKTDVGIGSEAESSIAGSGNAFLVTPRFRDFGGMKELLEMLIKEVIIPLYHPVLPRMLRVRPITGILLHGPPGCGKSKLAHAIANETGFAFYPVSGPEIVSGVSGSSEENIRELFQKAYRTAPSILFIDEIDAIASKRENMQREMERRIITQLMTCMDGYHRQEKATGKEAELQNSQFNQGFVLVIAATNRPDALDPALRRPGRFDFEIFLGVPDEKARAEILSVLTKSLKLEGTLDLMKIARLTPGFVAADLEGLIVNAGRLATKRIIDSRNLEMSGISIDVDEEHVEQWWRQPWMPEEIEKHSVTMADIEEAVQRFQPSTRREGFSEIPNVTWEDVGGFDSLKEVFEDYILRRIKYPKEYEFYLGQSNLETGILLFGPPGCGKTLIAKAAANEAGANFIHIKGPELLNKYVGESELAIRTLFSRARTCSPCILFFDEVDAITKQRGTEGGWVVERLLNQLLIELDGGDHRHGVFVIGATNRIDVMDTALLRPGRFGKVIYVGLPTELDRELILKALSRKMPIDPDVDLHAIARMEACKNLSGADLAALMNGAAMIAMKERFRSFKDITRDSSRTIKTVHVEQVLAKISPSVSKKDLRKLEKLAKKLNATS